MFEPLLDIHCALGENPLWQHETGHLYWTDIQAGRLHRLHWESRRHEIFYEGPAVGGFTFEENGGLLLFRVNDIALWREGGGVTVLRSFNDEGTKRFNDVIADPEGRVFAGTIGHSESSGGLYLFERDLSVTELFRGTGISNGMGFSPDLASLYWTDSTHLQIFRFDYARDCGAVRNGRLVYQSTEEEGIPDGMTVDENGDLWSARWDGYSVVHHAPDGTLLERIPCPAKQVSSVCFAGPNLDQLCLTSARGESDASEADGRVYSAAARARGQIEFRSRMSTSEAAKRRL